jgi:hypothetical protein
VEDWQAVQNFQWAEVHQAGEAKPQREQRQRGRFRIECGLLVLIVDMYFLLEIDAPMCTPSGIG